MARLGRRSCTTVPSLASHASIVWVSAIALAAAACTTDGPTTPGAPPTGATGCARTSIGADPINDLRGSYKGEPGGLYLGGSNVPPASHVTAGFLLARSIGPMDSNGNPDPRGRYAFVSIGPSFTSQEFSAFKGAADGDPIKRPELVVVDGAQGGISAAQWASPLCACWSGVDQRLASAGVTPRQVAAAWIQLVGVDAAAQPFPGHANLLRDHIIATVQNLRGRFPNLRLAYLSSQIYAGYATTTLSPEPIAYESGFAARAAIAAQINGDSRLNFDPARGPVTAPWLAWGPYMWADGLRRRSDGLTWACDDFLELDRTHPSFAGEAKAAGLLLSFVKTDSTARAWFER
jgi:hypothetical protein